MNSWFGAQYYFKEVNLSANEILTSNIFYGTEVCICVRVYRYISSPTDFTALLCSYAKRLLSFIIFQGLAALPKIQAEAVKPIQVGNQQIF